MNHINAEIEKEKKELYIIRERAEAELSTLPEGELQCIKSHNQLQFFHRLYGERRGRYLKKADPLILQLAKKRYNYMVLQAVEKNIKLLEKTEYDENAIAAAWDAVPPMFRNDMIPYEISDDEYVKKWEREEYERLEPPEEGTYLTDKGDVVRSKSEIIFADRLYAKGIPYKYERKIVIDGNDYYPDFTVLNVRTRREYYIEHFGMMDDPQYVAKAVSKIIRYQKNGLDFLFTCETLRDPLSKKEIDKLIQDYLL